MISKEILIAYINTLSDKECKDIYLMLRDLEENKGKYLLYNEKAEEDKTNGIIKLTAKQYHNLLRMWGPDKLRECFYILTKYLANGKKVRSSHYTLLNGWVETQYNQSHKKRGRHKPLAMRFEDIKSKAAARVYVNQVPKAMLEYDINVEYLVNRWGADILPNSGELK